MSHAGRSARLALEPLEDRSLPALFGLPWPDAERLTVSFVPDGTEVANQSSDLASSFDARLGRAVWQTAVLRAMQTWAVEADVNFGVVADGGQALGTPGLSQGDLRFGDLRVGGRAMTAEAFSVSVPYDPFLSGTWAGDLLFNTAAAMTEATLYRVALHEVGHALGLPPSDDPTSVMYNRLGPRDALSAGDVAAVRQLYGERRADANEGRAGNDSFAAATRLDVSDTSGGTRPLVTFGDVTTRSDADVFSLRPPSGYAGPVTFSARVAGLSLLDAAVTVYDAKGKAIAAARSAGAGLDASVTLLAADPKATYYVEVTGAAGVFGVGRYALVTTFDARDRVAPSRLDALLRGAPSALTGDDLDELFRSPGKVLWDDEKGGDRDSSARWLAPIPTPSGARFEAAGSVSRPGEADLYRLTLPRLDAAASVLTVSVRAGAFDGVVPRVEILDDEQRPVASEVLADGEGTLTVQAVTQPGRTYSLRLSGPRAGNYTLSATAGQRALTRTTFAAGTVAATPQTYSVFFAETQLVALSLAATGGGVRLRMWDSAGVLVVSLTARAGGTASAGSLLLAPGVYRVEFAREPGATGPARYSLFGGSLSDPIGPTLSDPTLAPQYLSPTDPSVFLYPGGYVSPVPFLWVLMAPNGTLMLPGLGAGFPVDPSLAGL